MKSKWMNIGLWVAQILLGVTLVWAGAMKLFKPSDLPWAWIKENPNLVTTTGILDLLAGLGLVLPMLLNIKPKLTFYASLSTVALMIGASIFHIARGEAKDIGFNVFVAVLAGFIAWGRK
jgi:uncharacterized membrane protein YphA (DoxX/SURF4 family)